MMILLSPTVYKGTTNKDERTSYFREAVDHRLSENSLVCSVLAAFLPVLKTSSAEKRSHPPRCANSTLSRGSYHGKVRLKVYRRLSPVVL